ncbi:MAG: Localization factor PodJL [Verrucomicrobiota bacterium]|jgi:hypothetical protein
MSRLKTILLQGSLVAATLVSPGWSTSSEVQIKAPEARTNPDELDAAAKELAQLLEQRELGPSKGRVLELAKLPGSSVQLLIARMHYEGLAGQKRDPAAAARAFALARKNGMPAELLDAFALEKMAQRRSQSPVYAYVPVPHLKQGYNMCAPTSAAMVLVYLLGHPIEPRAVKLCSTGSELIGTGTCWDHLVHGIKAVSGQDWVFRSFPVNDAGFDTGFSLLRREVEAQRPALIDLGPHTVVFVGYDAKKSEVYIQNPAYEWPGVHSLSYKQFKESWHSPWHVSTSGGVEARPILLTPAKTKSEKR